MKNQKNKSKISAFAFVLVLTISAMLVSLPAVTAHDPAWEVPTWSYCTGTPSPVGVDQNMMIIYWLNWIPPTANGRYGDRWIFTIDITKPDGTKQTMGPFTSDPIGGGYYNYMPDQVGTYTFVANFLGGVVTYANPNPRYDARYDKSPAINDTYLPSTSQPWSHTVQQEQITLLPQTPLPTDYWTRPINAYNREWYTIAGNWLGTKFPIVNSFQPFSSAPKTAHIVWTKPLAFGGIVGGLTGVEISGGATSYYTGSSYERMWDPPIIINGVLYYNERAPPREGWYAVDLRTGETMWFKNSTGPLQGGYGTSNSGNYPYLSFGQILEYNSVNQEGAFLSLIHI